MPPLLHDGPQLYCVAPHLVEAMWPHVVRWIEQAMERSRSDLTAADIKSKIEAGKALLWIAWDGALIAVAVTELAILPNGRKVCVVMACGGRDIPKWKHLLSGLENHAKQEGCEAMRFYGRAGWARLYREQGYRQPWVVVEKDIK